jgi:DNA-directed RNA polymerase II subunit RPB2
MTFRQEDLPFTSEGIIPDLIINPHCIPSRMTVGHVFECFVSKYVAVRGTKQHDATSFEQVDEKKIQDTLYSYGYLKNGSEFMFKPSSGIQN